MASEKEYADVIAELLEQSFHIEREVRGKCFDGTTRRADLVCRPRDPTPWLDGVNSAFVVEVKQPWAEYKQTTQAVTKAVAQCADYVRTQWAGLGYRIVFLAPGFDSLLTGKGYHRFDSNGVFILDRIAGQQGVGSMDIETINGVVFWKLSLTGQALWSSWRGPIRTHFTSTIPKFGSSLLWFAVLQEKKLLKYLLRQVLILQLCLRTLLCLILLR